MKAIEFKGQNVIFAKDQPEYLPLPAIRTEDGNVITCWEISEEELLVMAKTKKLYISMLTFNHPLQPIKPSTDLSDFYELVDSE